MAIFMDTGGGDIYAAETREECIAAIRKDVGEKEFQMFTEENTIFEVPGETKMTVECGECEDCPGKHVSTLAEEYTNVGYGYCIASTNC